MILVELADGKFGVYSTSGRFKCGPYDTPLLFKGTREECLEYRQ